jgi:HK97 family phage major capsid protein
MNTYTTTADPVRASIARELARYYTELSGTADKPAPRFSLSRLVREMASERGLHDGFEKEICSSAAIISGESFDGHRCWVPFGALARDMSLGDGNGSGYVVGSKLGEPWDILRTYSVTAAAGLTIIPNLRENLLLPKVSAQMAGGWVQEDGTSQYTESQPTIGQVSMTPKLAATSVDYTHLFMRQVDQLEPFLRQQLFGKVGQLVDAAVLAGSGSSGEPQGLINATGIGTQAGGSLDYADLVAMRSTVLTAGAREDRLRWIAPPAVQALLAARERVANGGRHLWDDTGVMGRPAHVSTLAPASTLIAGDFSQAVLAIWGSGLRLEVDPYSGFRTGKMTARVVLSCDVGFPQAGAFVVASSVS